MYVHEALCVLSANQVNWLVQSLPITVMKDHFLWLLITLGIVCYIHTFQLCCESTSWRFLTHNLVDRPKTDYLIYVTEKAAPASTFIFNLAPFILTLIRHGFAQLHVPELKAYSSDRTMITWPVLISWPMSSTLPEMQWWLLILVCHPKIFSGPICPPRISGSENPQSENHPIFWSPLLMHLHNNKKSTPCCSYTASLQLFSMLILRLST